MEKVFFGCAMRGGQEIVSREELERFPEMIEELGYNLASKHQTQKDVIEKENLLTKANIHDRDYMWELESNAGVFEISNPSLGVGGEISDMIHQGKPVLCLFKKGLEDGVSAYTQGKMGSQFVKTPFESYAYTSLEDAKDKIQQFLDLYFKN